MRLTKQVLSELGNRVVACSDVHIWSLAGKLFQGSCAEESSNSGIKPVIPVI